jgi:hypothetical protein
MRRRCETGSSLASAIFINRRRRPSGGASRPSNVDGIVAVPTSIAIVAGRIVVISISVVPVRAIIVRASPAPSPRITNPANLVDIGWRCRGRRDRHGAGAGCGERANCSGGCNSKDGFSHVIPHRIEEAAQRGRDELPVNSRRGLRPNQGYCDGDVKFRTIGKFVSRP